MASSNVRHMAFLARGKLVLTHQLLEQTADWRWNRKVLWVRANVAAPGFVNRVRGSGACFQEAVGQPSPSPPPAPVDII